MGIPIRKDFDEIRTTKEEKRKKALEVLELAKKQEAEKQLKRKNQQ
jgi:hypothetical protein